MSLENKLILFTGALVLLLAMYTFIDVMSWHPQLKNIDNSGRNPASVLTLEHAVDGKTWRHAEMITWSLDCLGESHQERAYQSEARQVRVTGSLCDKERYGQLKAIEVVNKSNGFRGTSFHLGDNRFTSDYIYLAEGPNHILVGLEGEHGDKVLTELVFHRSKSNSE